MTCEAVPVPTGPYLVGTAKIDLMDAYRKEIAFPEGRLIPIQIYLPYFNGTLEARKAFFDAIRKDVRSFLSKHLKQSLKSVS